MVKSTRFKYLFRNIPFYYLGFISVKKFKQVMRNWLRFTLIYTNYWYLLEISAQIVAIIVFVDSK